MLFTSLPRREKYKAKNFIDLFVHRAGDSIGSLLHVGLAGLGLDISGIAAVAAPLSAGWLVAAPFLGRAFERRIRRGFPADGDRAAWCHDSPASARINLGVARTPTSNCEDSGLARSYVGKLLSAALHAASKWAQFTS